LIHPSRAEGGALVIAEAISRNLVVLASRIPGNWGVLGGDYPGLFEAGQPNALAELLVRLQRDVGLCSQLREAIHALRGRLCSPQAELQALVDAIEASALSRP
jgi:glycosyltransferase involved in cell wall biosynthesis